MESSGVKRSYCPRACPYLWSLRKCIIEWIYNSWWTLLAGCQHPHNFVILQNWNSGSEEILHSQSLNYIAHGTKASSGSTCLWPEHWGGGDWGIPGTCRPASLARFSEGPCLKRYKVESNGERHSISTYGLHTWQHASTHIQHAFTACNEFIRQDHPVINDEASARCRHGIFH